MAKGEQHSNRETKKPKKEKIKTIAAAPSQKGVGSLQAGGFEQEEIAFRGFQGSLAGVQNGIGRLRICSQPRPWLDAKMAEN